MENSVYQLAILKNRQHSNSPVLWSAVLAGSILFNVGSVLTFQSFLKQIQPVSSAFESVAIEFVDTPIQVERPKTVSKAAISQTNPSSTPASPSSSTELYAPKNEAAIVEQTPIPAKQPLTNSAAPRVTSSNQATNTDQSASPNTTQDSSEAQPPVTSNQQESLSEDAQTATAEIDPITASPEEPATSGIALPPVPIVPNSQETVAMTETPPADPPAIRPNLVPSIVAAHVKINDDETELTETSESSIATDVETEIPEDSTRTFASHELGCSLTPDSLRSFGEPVKLEISVTEQGTVDERSPTTVQSSGGNDSYNNLAICVLKQWRFNVASSEVRSLKKAISRRLEVDVTLTR